MSNSHEVNGDAGKGNQLPSWKRVVGGGILAVTALGVSAGCSAEVSNEPGPTSSTVAVTPESPKPSVATVEAEPSSDNQLSPEEYKRINFDIASKLRGWLDDMRKGLPGGDFPLGIETVISGDSGFVTRSGERITHVERAEGPSGDGTRTAHRTTSVTVELSDEGPRLAVVWEKSNDCKNRKEEPVKCPDGDIESRWMVNMSIPRYDKEYGYEYGYGYLTFGEILRALDDSARLRGITRAIPSAQAGGVVPEEEFVIRPDDGAIVTGKTSSDLDKLKTSLRDLIGRMPR